MAEQGVIKISNWRRLDGKLLWETSLNIKDSYFSHPSINFTLKLDLNEKLKSVLVDWDVKKHDNPNFIVDRRLLKRVSSLSKYLNNLEQSIKLSVFFDDAVDLVDKGMSIETAAMIFSDKVIKQKDLPEESRYVLEQETKKELEEIALLRELDNKRA